ncbi:MAG: hypothetical protein K2H20_01785 [Bacilli bacterium]|nr:hypothetical protein [Bacilli bacterium]
MKKSFTTLNEALFAIANVVMNEGFESTGLIGDKYNSASWLFFLKEGTISVERRIYHNDPQKIKKLYLEWQSKKNEYINMTTFSKEQAEKLYNEIMEKI